LLAPGNPVAKSNAIGEVQHLAELEAKTVRF